MNATYETRITNILRPYGLPPKVIDSVLGEVKKDITLMNTGMNRAIDLLGKMPVMPGAQDIYNSLDLLRKQYSPSAK